VPVPADQVDARVKAAPPALPDPALHRGRGHPGRNGLGEGDHAALEGDQPLEGHAGHGRPQVVAPVAIPQNSAAMIDASVT
jgi:hypothetical protein